MKNKLKGFILGFLCAAMLVGGVAYAATGSQMIEAVYGITVYKDNIKCDMKDATGAPVDAFIYNGTTYLPVRAVSELANMQVSWNGATKSVYLWKDIIPDGTFLMDVCAPYTQTSNVESFFPSETKTFSMAGKKYSNGLTLHPYWDDDQYALFNLNGKYQSITMDIGPVDGNRNPTDIIFFVDDIKVAEYEVKEGDYPHQITVPLDYGLQLKIARVANSGNDRTGLGNITVK